MEDVFRVLKPEGIVCVYPMHLSEEEIEELPIVDGLKFDSERFGGRILIFKKAK